MRNFSSVVAAGIGGVRPFPHLSIERVPAVTADQMREVDRLVVEDYSMELLQLMENAGRALASVVCRLFRPARVEVLAGNGSNGGGAIAAARHLANRGVRVHVTVGHGFSGPVTSRQLEIVRRMGIEIGSEPAGGDVVVDGLIGYGLDGNPRGRVAEVVAWVNGGPAPIVALDIPTGLDATSGRTYDPCVRADATVTLALPKRGLLRAPAKVGRLFLADISVPAPLWERMGVQVPELFGLADVVELVAEFQTKEEQP